MPGSKLLARILEIAEKSHLGAVSVSIHDYETALRFSYQGDRWFHAASTFKAAILFTLLKAAELGTVRLEDQLQIRNRFTSTIDASVFRIDKERDGDTLVHQRIGKSMALIDLAHAMITRSSNLATNLLLDFLTLEEIRRMLSQAEVTGLEVRRGVEDLVAHEAGMNNEATADGLLRLFGVFLDERHMSPESRRQALNVLFSQEFNSMIPARLPEGVRVAHKTGEISTHCHDAGIVFVENRKPYIVAIMTETTLETTKRNKAVAEISAAVYRYAVGSLPEGKQVHD